MDAFCVSEFTEPSPKSRYDRAVALPYFNFFTRESSLAPAVRPSALGPSSLRDAAALLDKEIDTFKATKQIEHAIGFQSDAKAPGQPTGFGVGCEVICSTPSTRMASILTTPTTSEGTFMLRGASCNRRFGIKCSIGAGNLTFDCTVPSSATLTAAAYGSGRVKAGPKPADRSQGANRFELAVPGPSSLIVLRSAQPFRRTLTTAAKQQIVMGPSAFTSASSILAVVRKAISAPLEKAGVLSKCKEKQE